MSTATTPAPAGLPIEAAREAFERALKSGRIVLVTAPTGSGKSTRLPLWLAARGRVLVVEPRRVACRALATWLSGDGPPGGEIGYRVRFEDRSSAQTRVLFVTPGVALRMLASGLDDDTAVVVDEVHERSAQVDLTIALLRARHARVRAPLVMTSATVDAERLAATLDAVQVEAHGRSFPVDIAYAGAPGAPSSQALDERVAAEVERALVTDPGDVLVFLPGKKEIDAAHRALEGRVRDVELVRVHAQLPPQELSRALGPRPRGSRRVFLSTNVAETSLTLPGVTVVVDSGLVRSVIHRAGRSALALVPCARDQLDQRAGRAGRVAAGRAVRLFSAAWKPKPVTAPELTRVELDDLILQAAACGLGKALEDAQWLDPPPPFAVERARARLRALRALDDEGELTETGRALSAAPVSASQASLLAGAEALAPALRSTLCDVVALMDTMGSLELPRPSEAQAEARQALAEPDEVRQSLRYLREGEPRAHGLHGGRLDAARRLSRVLHGLIDAKPDQARPADDALAALIAARLPGAAFALRERADKQRRERDHAPYGNQEGLELSLRTYLPHDLPLGAAAPSPPQTGLILAHSWSEDSTGRVRGRGRLLLPCPGHVLADAGVGEVKLAAPTLSAGQVVAEREVRLGGRLIASGTQALRGAPLHRAAAGLVLEGRLVKGAKDEILDGLHAAAIAIALGRAEDEAQLRAPPLEFVAARLATLGVEESQDLKLVEVADLLPEPTPVDGDPVELARLREAFPRIWTSQGAEYEVVVFAQRKLVELRPVNAKARKAQEPAAQRVPRFEGFRVDYLKGSRRLRVR